MNLRKSLPAVFLTLALAARAWPGQGPAYNDISRLQAPAGDGFTFVVIGDRTGSGPDSWRIQDWGVAESNRIHPAFTIHIGDVIEGGAVPAVLRGQWDEAQVHLDSLRAPLFLVPGNHDIANPAGAGVWAGRFGRTYRAFDYGGFRFILLNTEQSPDGFGREQLAFLDSALTRGAPFRTAFVFMHRPAWLFSGNMQEEWNAAASRAGRLTVFAGHLHALAAERRGAARLFLVGPTGGRLRLAANPGLGLVHHVTRVSVRGDSVDVRFPVYGGGPALGEREASQAFEKGLKAMLLLRGVRSMEAQ